MSRLDETTTDRRPDESWCDYWRRKHDEKHGADCPCPWNRLAPRERP